MDSEKLTNDHYEAYRGRVNEIIEKLRAWGGDNQETGATFNLDELAAKFETALTFTEDFPGQRGDVIDDALDELAGAVFEFTSYPNWQSLRDHEAGSRQLEPGELEEAQAVRQYYEGCIQGYVLGLDGFMTHSTHPATTS